MSNIIYPAIIFIFILGAGMTFINESGLYTMKMPESGAQSDLAQAQEINSALVDTSKESGMSGIEQITLLGQCVFGGVLAIFTLGPMLSSFGVPGGMIVYLLSPLGFVLVFWLIEMWLGRSAE